MSAATTTPAVKKIQSFLTNGFLSGPALNQLMQTEGNEQKIATSYDDHIRENVALNCISHQMGIRTSLLHPAKGGLVVMVEERIGQKNILDSALERNREKIQEETQKNAKNLPSYLASYALTVARQFVLAQDTELLTCLSEKTHKTALFIFKNLTIESGENISTDGCKETVRQSIPADKIEWIILPKKYETEMMNLQLNNCKFVDSVDSEEFIFCYKDEKDEVKQIKIETGIKIPDYISALRDLAKDVDLTSKPIYTHMTRLPDQ